METQLSMGLISSFLLLICSQAASANLITNGSFELGTPNDNSEATTTLPPGNGDMTGWTVTNENIAWIENSNPWSIIASDGARFLDLTDYASYIYGGVTQNISTIAGQTYKLSFDLGSSLGLGDASIQASAGDTSTTYTATPGSISDWDSITMLFMATDTTTSISFVGTYGYGYIGLDNIVVSAVPLPAAPWLFGSGLLGLIGVARKKARA